MHVLFLLLKSYFTISKMMHISANYFYFTVEAIEELGSFYVENLTKTTAWERYTECRSKCIPSCLQVDYEVKTILTEEYGV